MVDGGISSGFPVDIFDRRDGIPPRWPTFYIGLQTRPEPRQAIPNPTRWGLSYYTDRLLNSAIDGRDTTLLADPSRASREVLIYLGTTSIPTISTSQGSNSKSCTSEVMTLPIAS
jgi:NTE family protein